MQSISRAKLLIPCDFLLSYVFQYGSADIAIIRDKDVKIKEVA